MIDLGPHAVFIVAAYAGVLAAVLALIGWTLLRGRAAQRRLAALEAVTGRQRSAA